MAEGCDRLLGVENLYHGHTVEPIENISLGVGYRSGYRHLREGCHGWLGIGGEGLAADAVEAHDVGRHGKTQGRIAYKAETEAVGVAYWSPLGVAQVIFAEAIYLAGRKETTLVIASCKGTADGG